MTAAGTSYGPDATRQDPPVNGANRYAHIDALRAFAVLLVVVAHAGLGHVVPGGSGVTIFFAISGFIITYLLLRERSKTGAFSARGFYLRRAFKIAPPFVLIILVPTAVYAFFAPVGPLAVAAQVFFVSNWVFIKDTEGILPGSGVVWSLSIEEQFYLAFALIWMFTVRLRYWRAIITFFATAGVIWSLAARIVMSFDPESSRRIYYGSDTRLDGIAWGVLAAIAYHLWQERGSIHNVWTRVVASDWALLGGIGLYALSLLIRDDFFRDTIRFTLQSISTCLVILYGLLPGESAIRACFYKVATLRLVSLIGLASYSIYLVHQVLVHALRDLVDLPAAVETLLFCGLGVGAGIAIYLAVEVPVHRWSTRRTSPKDAAVRTP